MNIVKRLLKIPVKVHPTNRDKQDAPQDPPQTELVVQDILRIEVQVNQEDLLKVGAMMKKNAKI